MESNGVQSFSPIEEPGVHVLLADPLLEDKVNALEQRMAPVLKALTDMTKPWIGKLVNSQIIAGMMQNDP